MTPPRAPRLMRLAAMMLAALTIGTIAAHADTMYSFTLTPTIKAGQGSVGGTGVVTFSTPIPLTGNFDANQNGTVSATTTKITALTVTLSNGLVFTLANASGTDIGFFNDKENNFSYYANSTTPLLQIQPTNYQFSTNGNFSGSAYSTGSLIFNTTPITAAAPTPEPSSLLLLGTGLLSVAGVARRKFFA